jgi:ribonucleotide reductase beta subunit family protein with ferritin-like domain
MAFFANSDNVVIENLFTNLMARLTIPEIRMFFGFQQMMEGIHVETYNLAIDAVINDPQKKKELFMAVEHSPIVQKKLQYALEWVEKGKDPTVGLATLLVVFACVEGIFFASSFAGLLWLRQIGKCPGICFANEKIVEDECIHVRHMCLLYRLLKNKLPQKVVHDIIKEAVSIEHFFVQDSIPQPLMGLNQTLMKEYVHVCADALCRMLGVPTIYNCANPFLWMEELGLLGKANFFEKRVGEYLTEAVKTDIPALPNVGKEELDF